jgi:hypothetical protein
MFKLRYSHYFTLQSKILATKLLDKKKRIKATKAKKINLFLNGSSVSFSYEKINFRHLHPTVCNCSCLIFCKCRSATNPHPTRCFIVLLIMSISSRVKYSYSTLLLTKTIIQYKKYFLQ